MQLFHYDNRGYMVDFCKTGLTHKLYGIAIM